MNFETLIVERSPRLMSVKLARPSRGNSINAAMVHEISAVLDEAAASPEFRVIVLKGDLGLFCTGMDFQEIAERPDSEVGGREAVERFTDLLKRFTLCPKVIVCHLDG